MPRDLTDKPTLVQLMAWCHQATSHYLRWYWLRSMSPCGIIRPWWVKCWIIFEESSVCIYIIPPSWNYTGGWNPCSWKTRYYRVNSLAAGDLVTQGARASAATIFTISSALSHQFLYNYEVINCDWLKSFLMKWFHYSRWPGARHYTISWKWTLVS